MADNTTVSQVVKELVERVISRGLQELSQDYKNSSVTWASGEEFSVENSQKAIEKTVEVIII